MIGPKSLSLSLSHDRVPMRGIERESLCLCWLVGLPVFSRRKMRARKCVFQHKSDQSQDTYVLVC